MSDEPPALGNRFEQAVLYALLVHAGSVRKGTAIPYVSHLLAVTALVLEDGGDEDEAIGALLHDTAEDAGGETRLADVRARFGERVGEIVAGCSDTFETPKPPWRQRKERYIERLRTEPSHVLRVSLADKLHNLRAMSADWERDGHAAFERFNAGIDCQRWYYTSLRDVFRERLPASSLTKPFAELADAAERDWNHEAEEGAAASA